ncbi:hypothetical protein [Ornithinibacillus contaminans]|uniref:hypothetical protein n=1 Tax=Ornithinibacillus contaminans TaxID=694055 RepID=UPI00064DF186|nr:hypothetical protein [Ornithinibacillus contaminans]
MSLYFQSLANVLKNNFMLVLMAAVLLVMTYFIWFGVPIFIIGSAVADVTSNLFIIHVCVSLSGGILFSLYFVPFNLKVAKKVADLKHGSVMHSFIRIEIVWIVVCALIFEVVICIAIYAWGI